MLNFLSSSGQILALAHKLLVEEKEANHGGECQLQPWQ
jgi:hypothetical protein